MQFLDDGTVNIIFGRGRDASTAVHEFAHVFRELAARTLALDPTEIADQAAFDSFKEGWAAAEAWLARFDDEATLAAEYAKYGAGWGFGGTPFASLTAEEKARAKRTAQHEYFARGFERYLMEGEAPSAGLRKLFADMKKWLLELYRSAAALDVELTAEARSFFDLLLASEEELAAEAWRGEMALTPAELDEIRELDPRAAAEHDRAAARAREEAEKQITAQRVKERVKMKRQWRKWADEEARQDPRTMMVTELVTRGGLNRQILLDNGYDAVAVNEQLAKIRVGLVRAEGGRPFDEAAAEFGYESGDDFIQALLNAPTLTTLRETIAAEYESEYDAAAEAELEAGLTEAEMEVWDLERRLWAKYMERAYQPGGAASRRESLQAIRAAVKNRADQWDVDQLLRANQTEWKARLKAVLKAARAEGRAARKETQEAGREALKEAKAEARTNKRLAREEERRWAKAQRLEARQKMAAEYKELTERRREAAKFQTQAKYLIKQKVAVSPYRAGGIRPDFHLQIKNLLAEAGLGSPVAAGEGLAEFARRMREDGAPIEVAENILNGSIWQKTDRKGRVRRRTWRRLSWLEFSDLRDAVDTLAALGRRQQQVRVGGALMSEELTARKVIEAIKAHNPVQPAADLEQKAAERTERISGRGGLKKWFQEWRSRPGAGLMPSVRKMQHLAYELDGQTLGGFIQRVFYDPANQAHNQAITLTDEFVNNLKTLVAETVGEEAFRGWGGELIPLKSAGRSVTKSEIVMAVLNMGNAQNRTALANDPIAKDLAELTRKLTSREYAFVQGVWDLLDHKMFPLLDGLTRRTKGIPLRKVEAQPLTVTTADGQTLDLRGGYFPLVFDRDLSSSVVINSQMKQEAIRALPGLFSPAEVQASATIHRVGQGYQGLIPDLNLAVLVRSIKSQSPRHRQARRKPAASASATVLAWNSPSGGSILIRSYI